MATHGVLGDCVDIYPTRLAFLVSSPLSCSLLSIASGQRKPGASPAPALEFLHQRRQPSPGTEGWRTPHSIGATACGIFFY